MTATGFSPAALAFFEGLAADNSKAFWQANRAVYDDEVKGAMEAVLADLGTAELGGYGPFKIFRPYNDVRFAKGRPPYKEQIGAVSETEGGAVVYVQFSAAGLMAGTGYHSMASDQLELFRRAIDDEHRGAEIAAICASLVQLGYSLGAMQELKTAPRGFARDHPRIELLRRKGLVATVRWAPEPWLHTRSAVTRIRDVWTGASAMTDWLDTHVGPSQLPPDDWDR